MAGSRFAYVRSFELPDPLLPTTFFVIRLDGKGFHGFSKAHDFDKPNDVKALDLMNEAARRVMNGRELGGECVAGFGESDEFRCVWYSFHVAVEHGANVQHLVSAEQLCFQALLQTTRAAAKVCFAACF